MPFNPTHRLRRSGLFIAFALLLGALVPAAGQARAITKAAPPVLSIDAKQCKVGPTETDRTATLTASALLGTTGDRIAMRFSLQQWITPAAGKARYRTVVAATSGLGKWELGESGRSGLRYTKILNRLAENARFRVVVEARVVDAAGEVVTRTAKKTMACAQPLFTPTLQLVKAVDTISAQGDHVLTATVRNRGRLTSAPLVLTATDFASPTTQLGLLYTPAGLLGGATQEFSVPLTACNKRVSVYVDQGAPGDPKPLIFAAAQSANAVCAGDSGAKAR